MANTSVSIRVRCRGQKLEICLIGILLLVACLGNTARRTGAAVASGWQVDSRYDEDQDSQVRSSGWSLRTHRYYLTQTYFNGTQAKQACAEGYHMASLWEILDPSNLKYDTSQGISQADSGAGPPSYYAGWVRTGSVANVNSTPGQANCNSWSSNNGGHYGTAAYLPKDWTTGQDLYVWKAYTTPCINYVSVWCVEDDIGEHIYLPLLLR